MGPTYNQEQNVEISAEVKGSKARLKLIGHQGFSSGIGSGSVLSAPLLDQNLSRFGQGEGGNYIRRLKLGRQAAHVVDESLNACAVRTDVGAFADKSSSRWRMSDKEDDDLSPPVTASRIRRRQTNREASQRARQRQLTHYTNLKKRYFDLQCTNTQLNYEAIQLRKERDHIRQTIESHECILPVPERDAQRRTLAFARPGGVLPLFETLDIKQEPEPDQSEDLPTKYPIPALLDTSATLSKPISDSTRPKLWTDCPYITQEESKMGAISRARRKSLPDYPFHTRTALSRSRSSQDDTIIDGWGDIDVKEEPYNVRPPDHTYASDRPIYKRLRMDPVTKHVSPSLPLTPVCDKLKTTSLTSPGPDLVKSPLETLTAPSPGLMTAITAPGSPLSTVTFGGWNPLAHLESKEISPAKIYPQTVSRVYDNVLIPEDSSSYHPTIQTPHGATPGGFSPMQTGHSRSLSWTASSQPSATTTLGQSSHRRSHSQPTGKSIPIPILPEFSDEDSPNVPLAGDYDLPFSDLLGDLVSDNSVFPGLDEAEVDSSSEILDDIQGDDLFRFDDDLGHVIRDFINDPSPDDLTL